MLLDAADPILQTLDAFLNLPVGELDERAGFPELLIQIGSIVGMTPVEMHLEPFGNQLEFVSKSFGQNTGVTFGIGNFNSNSFSCSADDLLNLRERFLIHTVFPYEATNFMALAEGSQTELPAPGWSPLPGSASSTSKYCYSKKRTGGRASHCAPGTEKGMEPDDLLCSRNARPRKTLAWANGTSRRASGWAGEKVARSGRPIRPHP